MKRSFLFFITLLISSFVIARAGELDTIISRSSGTILYLYSPTCTYCQKFDPNYKKLSDKYGKTYQFVRLDVNSKEGYKILSELGVRYVPYVMVFNAKKHTVAPIAPDCMLSYSCSENVIKDNLIKE